MKWLAAAVLGSGVLMQSFGYFDGISPFTIRDFVLDFGVIAPLVFIVLFVFAPLAPFFNAVLAMAGGLVFGLWQGSALIMVGALLGGSVGFWIARTCGGWLRRRKGDTRLQKLERRIEENGFFVVLLLRLIPLIPFDMISYGAGFSTVRYRDYIVATALGIVPGVLVYANIGANAVALHSQAFYLAVGLLAALTAVSWVLKKRLGAKLDL